MVVSSMSGIVKDGEVFSSPLSFLLTVIADEADMNLHGKYLIKRAFPDGVSQLVMCDYPFCGEGRYNLHLEPYGKNRILEVYKIEVTEKIKTAKEFLGEVKLIQMDGNTLEYTGKVIKVDLSYRVTEEGKNTN